MREQKHAFVGRREYWIMHRRAVLVRRPMFPSNPEPTFFFSSRRRHTRSLCDWSSDVVLFRSAQFGLISIARSCSFSAVGQSQSYSRVANANELCAPGSCSFIFSAVRAADFAFSYASFGGKEIGRASCRERV